MTKTEKEIFMKNKKIFYFKIYGVLLLVYPILAIILSLDKSYSFFNILLSIYMLLLVISFPILNYFKKVTKEEFILLEKYLSIMKGLGVTASCLGFPLVLFIL